MEQSSERSQQVSQAATTSAGASDATHAAAAFEARGHAIYATEKDEQSEESPRRKNQAGKRKALVLPLCIDMHTHLRQGSLMRLVTPMIKRGGCGVALVMPNTIPPIVTCAQAKAYREQLQNLDSTVKYMMTLYLCGEVTEDDLRKNARACHVTGVKCYPRGVTTNSEGGVEGLNDYYRLFEAMQELGLVLHIHGEVPGVSPLEAETRFLPVFEEVHAHFPRLQIVLEHVSTAAAIRAVQSKPKDIVAATITPHHLVLTVEDVLRADFISNEKCSHSEAVAQPHNFCKPLAKRREDREALRQYVATIFEELGCLHRLRSFALDNATTFLRLKIDGLKAGFDCVMLDPKLERVPPFYALNDESEGVVPFMAGRTLPYSLRILPYDPGDLTDFIKL